MIQWIEPHGPEDFIWLYTTQCPVVFERHTCHRPYFTEALRGGFGWSKDHSGGIIIIDGGGVSDRPCPGLFVIQANAFDPILRRDFRRDLSEPANLHF